VAQLFSLGHVTMKLVRQIGDLVLGIVYIGVAPLCVFIFLPGIILQTFALLGFSDTQSVLDVVTRVCLFGAIAFFGLAIWWRARHRITPRALEFVEIAIAILLGLLVFEWYVRNYQIGAS